jgi:hypothetical protein
VLLEGLMVVLSNLIESSVGQMRGTIGHRNFFFAYRFFLDFTGLDIIQPQPSKLVGQ